MPKIGSITTQVVSFPVEPPVVPPSGRGGVRFIDNVIIDVETEDGCRGSSYVWMISSRLSGMPEANAPIFALEDCVRFLGPIAVGEDVFNYERIWNATMRVASLYGLGLAATAQSGIDMAIWDALCKTLGHPLHRLLGGIRADVPFYSNELIHFYGQDVDELVAAARGLAEQGFAVLKMPIAGLGEVAAVERVQAVCEAIGPEVSLAVDLGSMLSLNDALRLGSRLEEFELAWIEDPVPFERVGEYAQLCDALRTPIAGGETGYSHWHFREVMEKHAVDMLIFEPMRAGGITGAIKLAALAEAFDIPIAAHVYHDLAVQLLSGFPAGKIVEYLPWWAVLLESPVSPIAGSASPPDRPGIGLHFDRDALERYKVAR